MMKFLWIKDETNKVVAYTPEKTDLIFKIERLINDDELFISGFNCYGYLENDVVPLKIKDIERFYIEDDKTFCAAENKKYKIKLRLYQIEEKLNDDFIKINQSDIININYIKRFNSSITGTLLIEMKNGDTDYVSRRMIKNLKERLGI